MSGIEEAYAKYAKGIGECRFNQILDRQDSQGRILVKTHETIQNLKDRLDKQNIAIDSLQHQINCMRGHLMGKVDQCEEEDKVDYEETRSDLEIIKQQLYENYQLLEKIDKYIRL